MGVYNNEEEPGRRKVSTGMGGGNKSPARRSFLDTLKITSGVSGDEAVLGGARVLGSAGRETIGMLRQGFKEAGQRKTWPGKVGAGIRTLATVPVSGLVGAGEQVAREAAPILRGVGEFGRAITGKAETPISPAKRVVAAPADAPTGAAPAITAAEEVVSPVERVATTPPVTAKTEVAAPAAISNVSMTPGSGTIITPTGSIRMLPSGEMIKVGDPSVGDGTRRVTTAAQTPSGEQRVSTYRQVPVAGGYRLPEREEEDTTPVRRRVEDIPEPETIGEVPVYRRKVEALQADIATDQAEAERAQRAAQFEARQEQGQGQFETEQAAKQGRFETTEGRLSRAEQRAQDEQTLRQQQLEAEQAAKQGRFETTEGRLSRAEQRAQSELGLKQKRFEAEQEARTKLNDAIQAFSTAKTPEERQEAATKLNIMAGKGVQLDKKTKAPAWKPKEVSDALGDFREFFAQQQGEGTLEEGADFYNTLLSKDPGLYREAFGQLSPGAAAFGERVMTFPIDKLKADDKFKQLMATVGKGMTPEELQATLVADYVAGTQVGAVR